MGYDTTVTGDLSPLFGRIILPVFRLGQEKLPVNTESYPKTRFPKFYDRMTVHRNRLLVNKTDRCTEFQFYWY